MIEKLVSDLPEVYQPIHGHPELSGRVSRSCFDRLEHITRIHDALQRLLGRPLKVLDLGCAQGYFSFNLAERGAIVHGVDFLDKNVAVCNSLAQENPALQVGFETGRVEETIARLEPGQYDLVLGLSVFHHIVYEKGADVVRAMLEHAAAQSGALVVELALREEPLYWAPAQPEDPRALLESIAFVHEIARHGTHLAAISRPLFVASSRYWILEDQASRFDSWSLDPHGLAQGTHQASRRYFFSVDRILKFYRFDHPRGEHNKTEFTKEVRFLQKPPPAFSAPALIAFSERETDAWLAMQRLPGRLLLDLLREGAKVDSRTVLLAVLKQLAGLEAAGLYHDDVRTWNVLVAEDGTTHLIDYGSISSKARDCAWPGNPFLSFFIFVREVATGVVDNSDPLRTVTISPYGLPQPYRSWATFLWRRPLTEWSFRLMYQTLLETPTEMVEEPALEPNSAWMNAIEEAIQAQKLFANHIRQRVDAQSLEVRATKAEARAATAEAESRAAVAEARAATAEAESRAAVAEARAATAEAESRAAVAEARAATAEAESRAAVAEARAATV
jgi:O-antigen chain-terminating bifunctional methyltransferase/kinase